MLLWTREMQRNEILMKPLAWKALVSVSAMGAAWAARQAATMIWSRAADSEGPVNPADRSVTWPEAFGWAALAGVLAGVARVVSRRGAVAAWEGVVGEAPPGVKTA